MRDVAPEAQRLSTGVPGLDGLLGGGLLPGGVYLVEGPPGGGKTIMGNQLSHHHASQGRQAVYFTLLGESHERMLSHQRGMSFFRPELVPSQLCYLSVFKVLEAEGLPGLLAVMLDTVNARKATLVVLDGLLSALELAPGAREYKKFLHELQALASMARAAIILLSSPSASTQCRPEHTMVDGIIEISDELVRLRSIRRLRVRKLRGTDPVRGQHSVTISSDGFSVRPRLEKPSFRPREDTRVSPESERVGFGIRELDRMLCGGLPASSVSMLLGSAGSGKTTLGLQFLAAGAGAGEPGLFFGFYERPTALLQKGERIGLGLRELHSRGLLQFSWQSAGEIELDVLGERLLSLIREQRPKRLFLDSMQGFQRAADFPDQLRDVFSAIAEELEARQVTTVFSVEALDLFGPVIRSPIDGLSAITHNILVLRHVELNAHLYRLLSIMKLRDSDYDNQIREFRITSAGIDVANTFESAQDILSGTARVTQNTAVENALLHSGTRARGGAQSAPKGSILIVDDEFGFADLIAEILTEHQYRTVIAINGELALDAVRERPPDLILLDLMMPVLDGAETLRRLKAEPRFAAIPVVLMTALPEAVPPDLVGSYLAVLHKPFTAEDLFEVMQGALGRG
jgi:circadian clock protein KaiC